MFIEEWVLALEAPAELSAEDRAALRATVHDSLRRWVEETARLLAEHQDVGLTVWPEA